MNRTKIPWTDWSWTPVTGCTPISEGCTHCYAQAMAHRFGWPKQTILHPERLLEPRRHGRRLDKVFVCSTADLWHPDVPDAFIDDVVGEAALAAGIRGLVFQFLTKRADRLLAWAQKPHQEFTLPVRGLWLGVTAENQARADERIPLLLQVPAAVHFVSVEPMLGPVDLTPYLEGEWAEDECGAIGGRRLRWVICGGESGAGARPSNPAWFRALRDQCQAAAVPFFFKQHGEWAELPQAGALALYQRPLHVFPDSQAVWRIGSKIAGHCLDGRQWLEFPKEASR